MAPSWCRSLCLLFLASVLVLSAAALSPSPRTGGRPPGLSAANALVARMCDPRGSHPAGVPPHSWCRRGLHLRRGRHGHHHRQAPLPPPPPGRGGEEEEIDVRYGVAKRLVPTGPNQLHN